MSKYKTSIEEITFTKASKMFKALSNPHRLKLYTLLVSNYKDSGIIDESEEQTLNCQREFAKDLKLAPSTVSHHFKELKESGLIHAEKRGKNVLFWIDLEAMELIKRFFNI